MGIGKWLFIAFKVVVAAFYMVGGLVFLGGAIVGGEHQGCCY